MRALLQRVKNARVTVEGNVTGGIDRGVLIFLGITHDDTADDADYLARRCSDLRIFEDAQGKMNLSVKDVGGNVLVVSQFTLYGDTRKGNRPSFGLAAQPDVAEPLYETFLGRMRDAIGPDRVESGVFRAMMEVHLVNDGPVTVMVESK